MVGIVIDQSALAASGVLAHMEARRNVKRHPIYRSSVAIVVTLVHVLVVALLIRVTYERIVPDKPAPKTQLLWLLLPRANQISGNPNEKKTDEMIRQAYKAVQLLPKETQPEQSNAITVDPGVALGQALACGAGMFEYLTPDGRAHCVSKPWNFTYDRYGYIIMDMRDPQQRKKEEQKLRNSDIMAQQRNTAPTCVDPHGPCLGRIIHGN